MAPPMGSASYKKKDGTLALSDDIRTVLWTPLAPPGGPAVLSFGVSTITSQLPLNSGAQDETTSDAGRSG